MLKKESVDGEVSVTSDGVSVEAFEGEEEATEGDLSLDGEEVFIIKEGRGALGAE